jgi:hypothetical protein
MPSDIKYRSTLVMAHIPVIGGAMHLAAVHLAARKRMIEPSPDSRHYFPEEHKRIERRYRNHGIVIQVQV